jgi:lipoprotein-releasing system ATP-binding protein
VNSEYNKKILISVRGLCKSFDAIEEHPSGPVKPAAGLTNRIEVLKDADFDLAEGETVAVVGASGIGKSTLLHILGTLDRPDSGTILFRNQDILGLNNSRLAKFRNESVGFVFQFHHLLPEFSAIENAMMPGLIKGLDKKKARDAAEEILIRVGLKDRLAHRLGELSGGEQQRVALARALVLRPALLLADEPTGNLDRKTGAQIHELLHELNSEFGMTMMVATHNTDLASYMSHRMTIVGGQLSVVDGQQL